MLHDLLSKCENKMSTCEMKVLVLIMVWPLAPGPPGAYGPDFLGLYALDKGMPKYHMPIVNMP